MLTFYLIPELIFNIRTLSSNFLRIEEQSDLTFAIA